MPGRRNPPWLSGATRLPDAERRRDGASHQTLPGSGSCPRRATPAEPVFPTRVNAMYICRCYRSRGFNFPLPPQGCNIVNSRLNVASTLLGSRTRKCWHPPFPLLLCDSLHLGLVGFFTQGKYKYFNNLLKTQVSAQAQHSISLAPEQQQTVFPAESHFRNC